MSLAPRKFVVALTISVLLIIGPVCEAKRALGGSSKTGGGGYSTRRQPSTSVTKPTYNTNSGSSSGNSHIDAAKLSYPNYNSQPNRPASAPSSSNQQPIGWNVPNQNQAGPPPAYSASNVAGGAKTNMHEPPPVYQKPNYAAPPPSYNQATGTNYGAAPPYHGSQSMPAGATYHSPNNLPPGATYYNNPAQVPGGYPGGASYPAGGYGGYGGAGGYHAPPAGMPAGATYYPSSQSLPQGATYLPAGNALPPGAVLYSSPPQQTSSGLGFGSGLAAGAIGGAILGHVLTPTQTKVVEQAPAAASGGSGGPQVIIINNGQPVNATDGVTVVNSGAAAAAAPAIAGAAGDSATPAPLAPMAPVPAETAQNTTNAETPSVAAPPPMAAADGNATATNPEQPAPAPGGIICVPVRVNETDPNDATKMVEVEKIACYPAPPPPPPQPQNDMALANNGTAPLAPMNETPAAAAGSAPLAPLQPITPGSSSQQLQQESTMIGDQSMKSADNAAIKETGSLAVVLCFVVSYLMAFN